MATVIFYEKPGCINNTKQKALLKAAGHDVQPRSLLTEAWTTESLQAFFGHLPIPEWFNRSAPAVKFGEVVPENCDAETALQLMLQNPLLIRRPLIQVGDRKVVGFDIDAIDDWLGLEPITVNHATTGKSFTHQDLETCPRNQGWRV